MMTDAVEYTYDPAKAFTVKGLKGALDALEERGMGDFTLHMPDGLSVQSLHVRQGESLVYITDAPAGEDPNAIAADSANKEVSLFGYVRLEDVQAE